MGILRWFFGLVVVLLLALGLVYYMAGKASGPLLSINTGPLVGQHTPLEVVVSAPGGRLDALTVQIEQAGKTVPVYALDRAAPPKSDGPDRLRLTTAIGKKD